MKSITVSTLNLNDRRQTVERRVEYVHDLDTPRENLAGTLGSTDWCDSLQLEDFNSRKRRVQRHARHAPTRIIRRADLARNHQVMVSIYSREPTLARTRLRGILGCACVLFIVTLRVLRVHRPFLRTTPTEHGSKADITAYYINLRKRTDRRKSVERQLADAHFKYVRVDAVYGARTEVVRNCWKGSDNYTCAGMIGVKLSHLRALDLAFRAGEDLVAVFEDDFAWSPYVDPALVLPAILTARSQPFTWDVLLLAAVLNEKTMITPAVNMLVAPGKFSRLADVHSAQTTHGYIVRRTYLPKLRAVFESCEVTRSRHTAIDQCWKSLQLNDRWIAFDPPLGVQSPSYSDIELKHVDYFRVLST